MFRGYQPPASPYVVKYGRKEFLEPMLREGAIRICPASFYQDPSLISSIQDDEIRRTFFIPTFRERLAGQTSIEFQGHQIKFDNDDIVLPLVCPDYFLFSLSDKIYYRLPTDFDADSALVILDPELFLQRVIGQFLAQNQNWKHLYGPAVYYDPYRDYRKVRVPEMSKHFGYAYQREVRIAFRSKQPIRTGLAPQFLKIGPLTDFAQLVHT
jgi:hypothetical protein